MAIKWIKEIDWGDYFKSVKDSLLNILKGTGEFIGEAAGSIVGGTLTQLSKRIWIWILVAGGVIVVWQLWGRKIFRK